MRQGNGYVVIFAVLMTVICGGLLAGVAVALKPEHQRQELLNKQKKILGAAFGEQASAWTSVQVEDKYANLVNGYVININGDRIAGVKALDINTLKEYKQKDKSKKRFPVFEIKKEEKPAEIQAYVVPVYGGGLWDNIWGYVALEGDKNTISGIVFEHKAETPGLGARIADDIEFQSRFIGKKLMNEKEIVVSVSVQKGEGNDYSSEAHKVDGLSGASMTTTGLNKMLSSYFKYYEAFLKKK